MKDTVYQEASVTKLDMMDRVRRVKR